MKKAELETVKLTRDAMKQYADGHPLKDFMDEIDIVEALELLVKLTKKAK
jgi:hypothetical protein